MFVQHIINSADLPDTRDEDEDCRRVSMILGILEAKFLQYTKNELIGYESLIKNIKCGDSLRRIAPLQLDIFRIHLVFLFILCYNSFFYPFRLLLPTIEFVMF